MDDTPHIAEKKIKATSIVWTKKQPLGFSESFIVLALEN